MSTINARVNASTSMDVNENGVIPQRDLEANVHREIQKMEEVIHQYRDADVEQRPTSSCRTIAPTWPSSPSSTTKRS
eukprot:9371050-Pyramimonas_sp.AAC.1